MTLRDPYCYPGTELLRNIPDLRDQDSLKIFEQHRVIERILELAEKPVRGKFDLEHLRAIHRYLFQDVYRWAGEIRTVDIGKGGSLFCKAEFILSYARSTVFRELRNEQYLIGLPLPEFSHRLAHHFSEINALHPFREGNGRSTRVFIEQLACQAGYETDFSQVHQLEWNQACRESHQGRYGPLNAIFKAIVSTVS